MGDTGSYMNARTIQVREMDGNPGHEDASLFNATIITLLEGRDVHLPELLDETRKAVSLDIPPVYVIEDIRTYSEFGASGSGQEVILSLMYSVSDPALAGASGAIVAHLIEWAKRKKKDNEMEIEESGAEVSGPPIDLEFILFQIKGTLGRVFGISEDSMSVEEAELKGSGASVRIKDTTNGDVYRIRTEEGYLVTRICREIS